MFMSSKNFGKEKKKVLYLSDEEFQKIPEKNLKEDKELLATLFVILKLSDFLLF